MRLHARAVSAAEAAKEASRLITRTLDEREERGVSVTFLRPLADVQMDTARFKLQLSIAEQAGKEIPCLTVIGSEVPIPIVIVPPVPEGLSMSEVLSTRNKELSAWYRKVSEDPRVIGPNSAPHDREAAKGFFRTLLEKYVEKRFSSPKLPERKFGLPITVTSKTLGARVHFSPEFMHVQDRILGEPTSPVNGELIPGNYRFGLSVHGKLPIFDYQLVEIPPRTHVRLEL